MSEYDDDERPRRENMMQRRLRKARGEEVDDDLDAYEVYDDDRPRGLGGAYYPPDRPRNYGYGGGSRGCAPQLLYLVLGGLVALLVGALLLNATVGGLGRLFAGVPRVPDIREIIITPTPEVITGAAVVQRVQQLSKLETASYTIQTVIEVNQSQGNPIFDFFAGDALLLIAQGTVIAGVDLSTLTPEQVTVSPDGRTITLQLPPAQVFSASLDSGKTRVYSRNRGWFAPENKDLETLARQQAEQQILLAACEDGVLSKATLQAEQTLRQFLGLLDSAQVTIVVSPPASCAPSGVPQPLPTP